VGLERRIEKTLIGVLFNFLQEEQDTGASYDQDEEFGGVVND
jgi:hypothetical protein